MRGLSISLKSLGPATGYHCLWPIPVDHLLHSGVCLKGKGLAIRSIRGRFAALAIRSCGFHKQF